MLVKGATGRHWWDLYPGTLSYSQVSAGACPLVDIGEVYILVPCHTVKSLQGHVTWQTLMRFISWYPLIQSSLCRDLTVWQGTRILVCCVSLANYQLMLYEHHSIIFEKRNEKKKRISRALLVKLVLGGYHRSNRTSLMISHHWFR